jgi:hypothetical protein
MTRESPTPNVRTVDKRPYQRKLPPETDEVSQMLIPDTEQAPDTGPKVIASVFDADPAGEAAAANATVCRVIPDAVATSEALTELGEPREIFTPQAPGRVGVAPPRTQSNMAFSA